MKVKDLMRHRPKIVKIDTPLAEVWSFLAKSDFHMLPVVDKEGIIQGVITAEDILMHLVPDYRDFFSDYYPESPTIEDVEQKLAEQSYLTAKNIMNTTVYTVYQDHDIYKALSRMLAYNKRILPVTDRENRLVGFIVEKDIFKYLFKIQKNILTILRKAKK